MDNKPRRFVALTAFHLFATIGWCQATAPKPLFRDPVYDGAADPVLAWNRTTHRWLMFYTDRRANVPGLKAVSWLHGTPINIAQSTDGGATWSFQGTLKVPYGNRDYTYWAPEIIYHAGVYHMYLTIVPGIFNDWNAPREIIHLTSRDLTSWQFLSKLNLASDRVIDPNVAHLPSGQWRLWYKNERDHSHIYAADSKDLDHWTDQGPVITDRQGEGPKVFAWKGSYWMITDVWHGLGVYRSADGLQWTPQAENLLADPGSQPTDRDKGHHADVVVSGGRAFLFYFVHQVGPDATPGDPTAGHHTVIQVTELKESAGKLTCDRNEPVHIALLPPKD
jgi:hypothetical protein